jgi:hypothetical protein
LKQQGKPPRLRPLRMLRNIFLMGASTPPCGDARRGLMLDSNLFTVPMPAGFIVAVAMPVESEKTKPAVIDRRYRR